MVIDNRDQNGHQVTFVCHCITSPQDKTSQLLAFEPLLQTHLLKFTYCVEMINMLRKNVGRPPHHLVHNIIHHRIHPSSSFSLFTI
jgi:hypothetical protein